MTEGQKIAIQQLSAIQQQSLNGEFQVLSIQQTPYYLVVLISLSCKHIQRKPDGLSLHPRERFLLKIYSDFPIVKPGVWTEHARFANFAHVQWQRSLCIYQTESEWNPSDGMFGFIDRLYKWLELGAINQLDPVGAPLHPPVTYKKINKVIVPNINTPDINGKPWLGLAHLNPISDFCLEINNWTGILEDVTSTYTAATILLPYKLPFELPDKLGSLIELLIANGVSRQLLLFALQWAVINNSDDYPLFVIIGCAMRGISGAEKMKQHLMAFYIDPVIVKALKISISKYKPHPELKKIGEEAEKIIFKWAEQAEIQWCFVKENRPEIVNRRDLETPMSWFSDRTVSLWGCGALGSHVAEFLVRAGVKKMTLRDYGTVAPGLLSRQLFEKSDLGKPKSSALKERLKKINPKVEIEEINGDILSSVLNSADWTDGADILIDTSASNLIAYKLELVRSKSSRIIPIISLIVDEKARRGRVTLAKENYSGGTFDIARKCKIETCNNPKLKHFLEAFWPEERRADYFQPEPGCSDITFIGSATDIASLASMLLNCVVNDLKENKEAAASGHFVTQPYIDTYDKLNHIGFYWKEDLVFRDSISSYEVRISPETWKEMKAWINRNKRVNGSRVETGGIIFGQREDYLKIAWVTEVIGPPPDSKASSKIFICGISGVIDADNEKKRRTRRSVKFLGTWHTHPYSLPCPSEIDLTGITQLLSEYKTEHSKTLLLILGVTPDSFLLGAFLFERKALFENKVIAIDLSNLKQIDFPENQNKVIGLALSGGGSRAIAFHLGCLRALHDRGLLKNIDVISAVSGGAVIAAMYAYSNDSFENFEKKIICLLRRGLAKDIFFKTFLSLFTFKIVFTLLISGTAAIIASIFKSAFGLIFTICRMNNEKLQLFLEKIKPPFCRWFNRTSAFEIVLQERVFSNRKLSSHTRDNINIVINACELKTGSVFRFGRKESGCWRYGEVNKDLSIAHAVAASAAFPVLLPAIDKRYTFKTKDGKIFTERVFLTDGGVFDNLGISCFEPKRSSDISFNVFNPNYIICSAAGPGLFGKNSYPYWITSRLIRCFGTVHRKLHDYGYEMLHKYTITDAKHFVLSYLGLRDEKLPYVPPDLVKREEVFNYPTDFFAMKQKDIDLLSLRGEQLTRVFIDYYCKEL